jgi:hypothetical protein
MSEKEKVSVSVLSQQYSDEINTFQQPLEAVDYEIRALQLKRRKIELDIENSSKGVRLVHSILDMMTSLLAEDADYFVVLNDSIHRQNLLFINAMHYIRTGEKRQVEGDDIFDHLIFEAMDRLSDKSRDQLTAIKSYDCEVYFEYRSNVFNANEKDDNHAFTMKNCDLRLPESVKLDRDQSTSVPNRMSRSYNFVFHELEEKEEQDNILRNCQTKENTKRNKVDYAIWDEVKFTIPAICYITPKPVEVKHDRSLLDKRNDALASIAKRIYDYTDP